MSNPGKKLIRNSTAEFLIFTAEGGEESIEVRYEDETIWLSQKMMAMLFDVNVRTINEHLKNIFEGGELDQNSVIRNFRITASDGKKYNTQFYSLDAIISVGYRVNSKKATQFRQWATQVLRDFAIKGYVIDKKRMENGSFLSEDYFEHLLAEIREIRLSERRFYQKITDIYATSIDYNQNAPETKEFFAKVQNKLQFKHQMFQAEAAKAVCDVFSGQPKTTPTYLIDKGLSQRNFRQIKIGDGVLLDEEEVDFTGYKNGKIRIPNSDILNNLQQIQRSLQIEPSAGVFAHIF